MDSLLTPRGTVLDTSANGDEDALVEVLSLPLPTSKPVLPAQTPEQALEVLKSEPEFSTLVSILKFLTPSNVSTPSGFNITAPGPLAAQLVHVLVSEIVPNYWAVFKGGEQNHGSRIKKEGISKPLSNLELLITCVRSVAGINAVLFSIKQYIQRTKQTKQTIGGSKPEDSLRILLQLLQAILESNETSYGIWKSIFVNKSSSLSQRAIWKEYVSLVTSKSVGLAAEADDIIRRESREVGEKHWVANSVLHSDWLALNITFWAKTLPQASEDGWKCCAELCSKSFRLGHTVSTVKKVVVSLLLGVQDYSAQLRNILEKLPNFDQRTFLISTLTFLSKDYLAADITTDADSQWWRSNTTVVSAASGLIKLLIGGEELRKNYLIAWLSHPSGAGAGEGIAVRRTAVAALAISGDIEAVLEKSLQQFGDQLYIKHTPAMQQDVHAQVLLLSAGYVHRQTPLRLSIILRSSMYLNLVSNRLASSSPRARFLGMVVGEALSGLVDKGDKQMKFKMEEMSTPEARWYNSLVEVNDTVDSVAALKSESKPVTKKQLAPAMKAKPTSSVGAGASKIISIEEVEEDEDEDEDSDDEEFVPYAKPDSDAEDSDEDPTLITRNKPTAPVYIRDLISYLRDTESYDKQKLGLQTAAALIRRKATFGTEVSSHVEELATLLVGIQDKYDIENFQEMRLQGMIATIIALPTKMGQWFSKTFFNGDYSLSQRASVLTTLGLSARELGGFDTPKDKSRNPLSDQSKVFPSKSLPETMHNRYSSSTSQRVLQKSLPINALDTLSTQLQNVFIAPMATSLADKLTGPSLLKIRTFSSRMAVEEKRKKPTTNAFAKIVAEAFFFPLTGRFFIHLKAYGSNKSGNIVFQPYLLGLFVKTLALLLHASGPSTPSLPQMTSELWDLLLSLRAQAVGDVLVVESLLFAFLTLLEINEDGRKLVENHGRQLLETQEWVEGVFARVGGGRNEEDERVRMLAAGVVVRIREVVEKYQALLMGDMAGFQW